MGLLDFLLDGKKKKPEVALPAHAPTPTAIAKGPPMASGEGSSVMSMLSAGPSDVKLPPATPYTPPAPAAAKPKPKVESVHMNDALNLKGMIPEETLYSGNNDYIKEAAAQRYRQLITTEYATPEQTGLPGWLQTPLQKAHQYTAAGAGYMGDTMQGILGLAGVAKTSKLREAVLPEQELRRIEDYLGKYDPDMLMELTSEKAISGFSPVANTVGQGAAAFAQSYVAAAPIAKVLQGVPALNAIRAGSYGAKGIYALNVLDNAAGAVSAQMLHGLTREQDIKTVARRIAASPSILLPFHNNSMVGVGGIADFFAGKYFLGMSDKDALMHSLINLGPNVLRRMSVAGQVRTFNEDMVHVNEYFDGTLSKQGVPKPLRDEVMASAQKIYGYRKGNPSDFDGVAKLYDQEGSRLQGVFKEYMKNYGVGENRMIGLKGPDGNTGNPLLPGNPNIPQGMSPQRFSELMAKYGDLDNVPANQLDIEEANAVEAHAGPKWQKYPTDDGGTLYTKNGNLYRAMSQAEFDDAVKNGMMTPSKPESPNIPGRKYFDSDPSGAKMFGDLHEGGTGGNDVLVRVVAKNVPGMQMDTHVAGNDPRMVTSVFTNNPVPTHGAEFSTDGGNTWAAMPAATQAPQSSFPSILQNPGGPTATVPTAPGGLGSMLPSIQSPAPSAASAQPQLPGFAGEAGTPQPQAEGKTLQQQLQRADTPEGGGREPDSFDKIVKQYPTPVQNKVNLLDYMATPENVLKKIGLGKESLSLRRADEAYRKELPIQLDRIGQWIDRTKGTPDASQRIFQYLDGDKAVHLDTNELGVAKEMQDWFTMWAQRLGIKPEARFTDYVPHIFDMTNQTEFDEDLAKMIADKVPKEVYNPFLKTRKGMPGFTQDAFLAAEVYAKRAVRKVNLDPALEKVNKAAQGLEEKTYQYVKRYTQEINLRPVEIDTLTDNLIKSSLEKFGMDPYKFGARPTNVLLRSQRQMIYRGLIGGNVGSAVRNLTQGVNTYAELGEKYTTIGYSKLLTETLSGRASQELKDAVVLGMDISNQDRVQSARQKLVQAGDKALFSAFSTAEFINRGAAYYGAKAKFTNDIAAARKGGAGGKGVSADAFDDIILAKKPDPKSLANLSDDQAVQYAMEKAKEVVRRTQFQFGPMDAPLIMRGDLAKSAMQLQGFTTKQAEFLANKIFTDKDIAGLLRYTGASLAVLAAVGKTLGFDGKDFMPGVRIAEDGAAPPMFQLPAGVVSAILNLPDKYGRTSEENVFSRIVGSPAVQRGAMMYVPGGAQIQKSTSGISAFTEGEKRSASGKSQTFPIEQDVENFIRTFVYGPYGSKEGRDYIEKEIKGPGLLEKILGSGGGSTGAGSTTVPKSKYGVPGSTLIPKSKFAVPKR